MSTTKAPPASSASAAAPRTRTRRWRGAVLSSAISPGDRIIDTPEKPRPLDDIDREVLLLLQEDARITSAEIARRVQLSAPGVQKRLKKLHDNGVIQRYVALVRREAVGLDLLCFVQVGLAHHEPDSVGGFRECMKTLPEVLECHHLTGEFDYLLKVVARNHKHLERFLVESLTTVPGVDKIRTSIVLNEIKSSTALPLE